MWFTPPPWVRTMADCWIKYELTNVQRRCFALEETVPEWEKVELEPSPYDLYDSFAYLDGCTLRKLICVGEGMYYEISLNEALTPDRKFLLPKTAKGKPIRLTAANIRKRTPFGMGLLYSRGYVSVTSYTAEQDYFRGEYSLPLLPAFSDFEAFVEKWCAETDAEKLADIQSFAAQPRRHQKYREGDFFRFRLDREHWGYGRILLDFGAMRKKEIPFWDIFMGKPLCVSVYRIVSESKDIPIDVLKDLPSLPSAMVMDNIFFYGECEIIGNLPLPEDVDYPIHYGKGIAMGEDVLHYQCGRTHLTLPGEPELASGFRSGAIGLTQNVRLPVLRKCICQNSNLPYWTQENYAQIHHDLRNPKYAALLAKIQEQFSI